jgi:hypothetical protein
VSYDPRRPEPEPRPLELSTPRPQDLPPPAGPPPPPPSVASRLATALVEGGRAGARAGLRQYRRTPPRRRLIALAVVVVVLITVPATVSIIQRVAYAPEEPVAGLVKAFNDRNIARAAELAGCTSRLCRPDALRTGYEPPTGMSIADISVDGDAASVLIRYTVGGVRKETSLLVERDPGLVFRGWSIVAGATGYLDVVAEDVASAQVAGATVSTIPVPRGGGGRTGAHEALLGAYTVTPGEHPLYTAQPVTVTMAGELRGVRVTSVALELTVKPEVGAEVDKQVRARLDECARELEFVPRDCPFEYQKVLYKPADPRWRIDAYPKLEIYPSDRVTLTKAPLDVRTVEPGKATITYTSDGVPQTATVDVTVRGVVSVEAGKITWTG